MRVVVFDAAESSALGLAWAYGAPLFTRLGRFDHCIRGFTWLQVFRDISKLKGVTEVQFWGHGAPGHVFLDGEQLGAHVPSEALLMQPAFAENALWWWRTCATFAGELGHGFATAWTERIGCRIAGHTHNIGFPWHSGTHILRPRQMPQWSVAEGLDDDGKPLWSRRRAPNTIWFSAMDLPSSW